MGGPGGGELVGRLDAYGADKGIGGFIKEGDKSFEDEVEGVDGLDSKPGGTNGVGDGNVFGDELAKNHGKEGGDDEGEDEGRWGGPGFTQSGEVKKRVEKFSEDRFREVTGGKGGDSNAELGAG